MSPAERLKGGGECSSVQEIEVLDDNASAVQVYLRCQQTMLAGMSGAVILGVSASEAMASARMLRVPVREWPDVIDGVQQLASLVAKIENAKAAARAKAK
jgi:energy-converting hydrogenase Eha subunit G